MSSHDVNDQRRRHAFLFCLVRKHRSESNVTDALDVRDGSVELVVNDDTALGVDLNANLLEVEASCDWAAADGNKNDVRLELDELG